MEGTISIKRPHNIYGQSRSLTYRFYYSEVMQTLQFFTLAKNPALVVETSNLYKELRGKFFKLHAKKLKRTA